MTEETIAVPEIHCEHCKTSLEGALSNLPGVEAVTVGIEERSIRISYDRDVIERDTIVAAIEEQGYQVP